MHAKHARNSIALYAAATIIVAGSNFAATALLLDVLGPVAFATWVTLEPLILLLLPIAGFGLHIGLLNQIVKNPNAPSQLLPYHIASTFLVAGLAALIASTGFPPLWAGLSGLILVFEGSIVFFIGYWRAANRPVTYASIEGGRAASVMLFLAAMTLLPAFAISTVEQYLVLRAALGAVFLGLAFAITRWPWRPDRAAARAAMRYGLPIVVASAAVNMIMNFDRYAVAWVADATDLASYVAHVKTAQILGSAVAPFFTWFAPIAIARLQRGAPDDGMFGRSFLGFAAVDLALALGLWLVAPALWPLVFPSVAFQPAIMALLIVGMAIFAAGNPLSLGSLAEGSTMGALYVTLFAGGVGLIAVMILAPIFGPIGVALGKVLGFCAYTIAFALHTRRRLRVAYPWRKVAYLCGATLTLAATASGPIANLTPILAIFAASLAASVIILAAYAMDRLDQSGR